jgi:hypothetical protein
MYVCDNCENEYEGDEDLKRVFPDIPGLLQRLDPGGTVPAGECPECGALVYPRKDPVRVLILVDGGLVQDILADRVGVEAAVLDQDLEGVDDEEIAEVKTLRGTLQAHEVTLAPALVQAAWQPVETVPGAP